MVDSKGETEAFGDLLRRHRVLAGITQEELAQSASLSARAISDLERGVKRTPRRDTVRLLVGGDPAPERRWCPVALKTPPCGKERLRQ